MGTLTQRFWKPPPLLRLPLPPGTCCASAPLPDPQVVNLQQYAAMFGYGIVTNGAVREAVEDSQDFRLVAVDVLSLTQQRRGPAVPDPNPTKGSDIAYECVAKTEAQDDEWMYQLQVGSARAQTAAFGPRVAGPWAPCGGPGTWDPFF